MIPTYVIFNLPLPVSVYGICWFFSLKVMLLIDSEGKCVYLFIFTFFFSGDERVSLGTQIL